MTSDKCRRCVKLSWGDCHGDLFGCVSREWFNDVEDVVSYEDVF